MDFNTDSNTTKFTEKFQNLSVDQIDDDCLPFQPSQVVNSAETVIMSSEDVEASQAKEKVILKKPSR